MGHTSQRRDLDDPGLIAHFARCAATRRRCASCSCITFVDLYCVGPGQPHQLEGRAAARPVPAHAGLPAPRARPADRRARPSSPAAASARLLQEAGPRPPTTPGWRPCWAACPIATSRRTPLSRDRPAHAACCAGAQGPCALEVIPQRGKSYVELVVVADDVPGLLAKITGRAVRQQAGHHGRRHLLARAVRGADHRARRSTSSACGRPPAGAQIDEARIAGIRRDLEAVLEGRIARRVAGRLAGGLVGLDVRPLQARGAAHRGEGGQRDQPRLHRHRRVHRGPARRPVHHRPRAARAGPGHPPLEGRRRGRSGGGHLLRAQRADQRQDRSIPRASPPSARRWWARCRAAAKRRAPPPV